MQDQGIGIKKGLYPNFTFRYSPYNQSYFLSEKHFKI